MLTTLAVAWRTVTKRLRADWLILGAVFITVLLAASLLAAGPIYADAVTISALKRSIAEAPNSESSISAELKVFPDDYSVADRVARLAIAEALTTTGGDIFSHVVSDSYGLDGSSDDDATALVSFQYFEEVESRAPLISGRWPMEGAHPHEVALSKSTAASLGLTVDDTVDVTNRLDPSITDSVRVVGVFQVDDPGDPYWFSDPLIGQGETESGTFRTYGPFVVSLGTMLDEFSPIRSNGRWRAFPDYDELTVAEVGRLRADVAALELELDQGLDDALGERVSTSTGFSVVTGLPDRMAAVDRSLTVTTASVLALLIQLAILAGYALVLTAGLLIDTRRTETSLVRSRGTSPRQVVGVALLEGILVTLPAVLLAPFLAAWLLRLLNTSGPLATIDLVIDPVVNARSVALALLTCVLAIAVMVWPAHRMARVFGNEALRHRRQRRRPVSQRIGLDIGLVALTALAFWQLRLVGPQISATVRGRFGVDPLLVVTPALGLLAGAVLALRVIPLLALGAERLASSRRGPVAALASWQVARRPSRYSRASLLLIMAIGIGFLAASYSTTWIQSQRDQAAYQTGADIEAVPGRGPDSVDPIHLRSAYEAIPDVNSSMPVRKATGPLAGGGGQGQFVMLDAAVAPSTVTIRSDLAPDFADLMSDLVAARPSLASIEIPGSPDELVLRFETVEDVPVGDNFEPCDFNDQVLGPNQQSSNICFNAGVTVVLQDGGDLLHRVEAGPLPVNEGIAELRAGLTRRTETGAVLEPEYPLKLVGIEVDTRVPQASSRDVSLSLLGISAVSGDRVDDVLVDLDPTNWDLSTILVGSSQQPTRMSPSPASAPGTLTLDIETGSSGFEGSRVYLGLRPAGTELAETIPVVVSDTFQETNPTTAEETIRLTPLQIPNDDAKVVGTIKEFPTTNPRLGELIVLDLATYQMMGYRPGSGIPQADQFWLDVSAESASAVDALLAPPISSFTVASQQDLVDGLTADPVALSTVGALTVGFVAAAVFATVGFAVSATVSARERMVEFALLRALGLSRGRLAAWLVLEQGVLVVLSLMLGTLVGLVLTAVVLPLITLTQSGAPPVPEVIVQYPWETVAGLEIAVVAVLAVVVTVMTVLLRRLGLGALLRMGED